MFEDGINDIDAILEETSFEDMQAILEDEIGDSEVVAIRAISSPDGDSIGVTFSSGACLVLDEFHLIRKPELTSGEIN